MESLSFSTQTYACIIEYLSSFCLFTLSNPIRDTEILKRSLVKKQKKKIFFYILRHSEIHSSEKKLQIYELLSLIRGYTLKNNC